MDAPDSAERRAHGEEPAPGDEEPAEVEGSTVLHHALTNHDGQDVEKAVEEALLPVGLKEEAYSLEFRTRYSVILFQAVKTLGQFKKIDEISEQH